MVTPAMCVAGRELTEPKLSPDGSSVAFVATMGGSTAIVVVASEGGPERMLTTLPLPAPGRGLGGGCFDWLPDGSGIVYAAIGLPERLAQLRSAWGHRTFLDAYRRLHTIRGTWRASKPPRGRGVESGLREAVGRRDQLGRRRHRRGERADLRPRAKGQGLRA